MSGRRCNPNQQVNSRQRLVIYSLFALSGATSLAYEVVWTRLLIRVFGATSIAVATVLASWMAGLALGSYLFGRMIDRSAAWTTAVRPPAGQETSRPLRLYGLLELGIGLCALGFPLAIHGLDVLYGAAFRAWGGQTAFLTAARVGLSFAILLVPTTLMGGTLPILGRLLAAGVYGSAGSVGLLYAVNTLGAVFGAVASGYVLLPNMGLSRTTWVCVAANVVVFLTALLMSRLSALKQPLSEPADRAAAAGGAASSPGEIRTARAAQSAGPWSREGGQTGVLVAFMMTGFAALAVEVLWTRALSLVIGTTVYAFSAMLATFLLGLALGSAVFSRMLPRIARPRLAFGLVAASIGVAIFFTSIVFGQTPILYLTIGRHLAWNWSTMMWAQFGLCLLVMLVPTFLMGGTFPLVMKIYLTNPEKVGRAIGKAYAINTIGSILGSISGSFLLLALLGVERSLVLASAVYLAAGVILLVGGAEFGRAWRYRATGGLVAMGIAAVALTPHWDPRLMTSGVYRYAQTYRTAERLRDHMKNKSVLFYDDGPGATVAVDRFRDELSLDIDGKADASTALGDMTTQTMLAHLPLLFHHNPDTVLVIGLGCGVTLGSAELYPVRAIDCVEILPNVVRASSYFSRYNRDCLADPRVNLIMGDARNFVMFTDRKYDVIISEPTNPWIAGVGDLFTREFFRSAALRLKPGGVICAWFHTYQMGDDDLRSMARTFSDVFPECAMWAVSESDVIFLGSSGPLVFDRSSAEGMTDQGISADLGRVWIDSPADLLGGYVWGSEGLKLYGGRSARVHTDDNMMLEYSAAKKVFETRDPVHIANFSASQDSPRLQGLDPEQVRQIEAAIRDRRQAMRGTVDLLSGKAALGITLYDRAFAGSPGDPYVISAYTSGYLALAQSLFDKADYSGAIEAYGKAASVPSYPASAYAYDGLAACYIKTGDFGKAAKYMALSLAVNPYNRTTSCNLARLYLASGDAGSAVSLYERTLTQFPGDADAASGLARVYAARRENLDRALSLARLAARGTRQASYLCTLGWVEYERGDVAGARKAFRGALHLEPENSEALFRLGLLETTTADQAAARKTLDRLIGLGRRDEYTEKARDLRRGLR